MTGKVSTGSNEIRATVHHVDLNRKGGPIAIASAKGVKGRIFLSLDGDAWHSHSAPTEGGWVMLSGLERKTGRWVASSGRLYEPHDALPKPQPQD